MIAKKVKNEFLGAFQGKMANPSISFSSSKLDENFSMGESHSSF